MDWNAFKTYLTSANLEPSSLDCTGPQGTNATKDLLVDAGELLDATWDVLLRRYSGSSRDFVWFGGTQVKVMRPMRDKAGGGHPSLSGGRTVYCAGEVRSGYFRFKSGHYKPKTQHIVAFLLRFVDSSCAGLMGETRDQRVDELCRARHVQFAGVTRGVDEYKDICLLDLLPALSAPSSHPMPMVSSSTSGAIPIPRKLVGPAHWRKGFEDESMSSSSSSSSSSPKPLNAQTSTFSNSSSSSVSTTMPISSITARETLDETLTKGLSPSSESLRRASIDKRIWTPDTTVTKCQGCGKDFTMFRRKHHCRQCGNVFCDACTNQTKTVKRPVARPDKVAETGLLRVCGPCSRTVEL